jgi:hypothetical protein
MKLVALTVLAASGLVGCAALPAPQYMSAAGMEPDFAKINAINSVARAQGVVIVWINPPLKAAKAAGS